MNTQIRYSKRICPVQYEHEEMEVHFSVEPTENLHEKTQFMRSFVHNTLYARTLPTFTQTNTPAIPQETVQGASHGTSQESRQESVEKSSTKGSKKSRKQEEVTTSPAQEEMEEVPSPYTATQTEAKTAPTESSSVEAKAEKKSKKTSVKEEGIVYDCEKDEHKSTLTNFLTKLTGGKEWAKDKERSRKVSREVLHGQPFLAKDGKILPSFEALCKENYGATQDVL